jgi:hypothetical protein
MHDGANTNIKRIENLENTTQVLELTTRNGSDKGIFTRLL